MKKLLLLISLLLATNAWGEFKTLECSGKEAKADGKEGNTFHITFDPDLPDAEFQEFHRRTGEGFEIIPVKVTIFPSYYRFVWETLFRSGKLMQIDTLDLNRKDLSYSRKSRSLGVDYYYQGNCKLVEIDTSENIL